MIHLSNVEILKNSKCRPPSPTSKCRLPCNSFKISINIIDIMESGLTDIPSEPSDIETSTVISNLETKMEALESLESELPQGETLCNFFF